MGFYETIVEYILSFSREQTPSITRYRVRASELYALLKLLFNFIVNNLIQAII